MTVNTENFIIEGTSFPMPLSLSVTWDEKFIRAVVSAIADECRGHNQPLDEGGRGRDYVGEDGVVTKPGSVAMALMAGCDMDCNGDIYPKHAGKAVEQGLLDEAQINRNVYLSLLSRFRLGEFGPTDAVAYRSADYGFAATVETRDRNTFCTIRGFGPRDVATSRKILVY